MKPDTWAKRPRILALALFALLGACTAPGANLPPLPDTQRAAYKLGPEDQLRVTVYGDTSLTGEFRVSDRGTLSLPLVGSVRAAGMTTEQIEQEIKGEMKRRGLYRDPDVAVEVTQYRPIFVLGMVERGGQYPYRPGMTVLSAVAVAGGFNYRAIRDYVAITRVGEDGRPVEYRAGREALVDPGDVVNIFERRF